MKKLINRSNKEGYNKEERAKIYLKASKIKSGNYTYGACEKLARALNIFRWNLNIDHFPEFKLFKEKDNDELFWLQERNERGNYKTKEGIQRREIVLLLCYEMCKD